jgi:hypothetical protein
VEKGERHHLEKKIVEMGMVSNLGEHWLTIVVIELCQL